MPAAYLTSVVVVAWMSTATTLAIISPLNPYQANTVSVCSKVPVFLQHTTQLCNTFERPVGFSIVNATLLSARECQRQFRHRRWNCSSDAKSLSRLITHGFPETAFLYAIYSAGLAYSIALECNREQLRGCNCRRKQKRRLKKTIGQEDKLRTFEWSDQCLDDSLGYGVIVSRELMESDGERDIKGMLDRHNKEAGRQAVISLDIGPQLECRCHGISGACAVRTCWRRLPKFSEIGIHLRKKYDSAVKVMVDNRGHSLIPVKPSLKHPGKLDLVYTTDSPDFCSPDSSVGSLGTKDRQCVPDALTLNSCDILCCNRGFSSEFKQETTSCNCRFHNCCKVECETCHTNRTLRTCK